MADKERSGELLSEGKRMVTCVPHATYKALEARAATEQVKVAVIVRRAIQMYLRSNSSV